MNFKMKRKKIAITIEVKRIPYSLNGSKRAKMDRSGSNLSKWIQIDRIGPNGQNRFGMGIRWTKSDRIRKNA